MLQYFYPPLCFLHINIESKNICDDELCPSIEYKPVKLIIVGGGGGG